MRFKLTDNLLLEELINIRHKNVLYEMARSDSTIIYSSPVKQIMEIGYIDTEKLIISSVEDIGTLGRLIDSLANSSKILYVNDNGNILEVEMISNKSFRNDANFWSYLGNRKRELGSDSAFFYTEDDDVCNKALFGISSNIFTDIIYMDGNYYYSMRELNRATPEQSYNVLGKKYSDEKRYNV